ncbi:hypothetical protein [Halorientalis salina]|uniref:hypothetical protein n=1 Tax=Halorientalis salina TaxID=2932266 RepID=UPI00145E7367|nr:hypothetical protein [Halorientalis salina]
MQLIGLAFFVVAAVGTVVYDWDFSGDSGAVPTALALVAVAVAIAVTLLRRR